MIVTTITADPSIQSRDSLSPSRLEQFAQILESGDDLTPVTVFYDGDVHWLGDGFHRYEAYTNAGRTDIPAKIHQGTLRDAILCGIRSNAHHGIGLKLDERRNAAWRLLADPEWCQWNDKYIARICGLDHDTVKKIRLKIASEVVDIPNPELLKSVSIRNRIDTPDPDSLESNQNPELLRTVSIRNRIDRPDPDPLESSPCKDSIQQTSSQNPELLKSVSIRNRIDTPDPESLEVVSDFLDSDSGSNIRMVLRGNTTYPMKTGNIGGKGKTKKPTYDPLSNVIDITAHTIHEPLPPSRNNPPGAFTVHSVHFDEPLIADTQFQYTFKVLTSGPSFAMPLIFEMMEGYPLYAQHVLNEALKISAKINGSS